MQITVSVPVVGSPNSGSSLHWVGTTAQCWCTLPSRCVCHALALRRRTVHTAAMHRSRLPPAAAGPRAPACPKPSCPLLSPPQPAPFHAARSTLTRAAPSRCWTSSPTALSSPTPSPGPASECAFCWELLRLVPCRVGHCSTAVSCPRERVDVSRVLLLPAYGWPADIELCEFWGWRGCALWLFQRGE